MVHGRTDSHSGGHLIIEETPNFGAKRERHLIIGLFIPIRGAVNTPRQIAFELLNDLAQLVDVSNKDENGRVSKRFRLKRMRV